MDGWDSSATAFFNALIREWPDCSFCLGRDISPDLEGDAAYLAIRLAKGGQTLFVRSTQHSSCGYHGFASPIFISASGGGVEAIAFADAASILLGPQGLDPSGDIGRRMTFLRRVLDSIANAQQLDHELPQRRPFEQADADFAEAESSLRYGHAVHPNPLSRDEFSPEDTRRYGHSHGQHFSLVWWAVAGEAITGGAAAELDPNELSAALSMDDRDADITSVPGGRTVMPLHPWQASVLRRDPDIESLFRRDLLIDLGSGARRWRATTSLRSVYAADAEFMLKFSMSLRLTNSRRIIEERECKRGLSVHGLMKGPVGRALRHRCPQLTVMGEPAWLALKDGAGNTRTDTIVAFRENPFRGADAPKAAALATLCERVDGGKGSHVADLIRRIARGTGLEADAVAEAWFARYLDVGVAAYLIATAEFGLLFGAHQQNTVLGLRDGWPDHLYFRDCQGTGYVSEFLPLLRETDPDIGGPHDHVFTSKDAAKLLGYYLVINGVFAVVSAIAAAGLSSETRLLSLYADFLDAIAAQDLPDPTVIRYLRHAPELLGKGNFMISLRGINENTEVTDPLAGYVPFPNPISDDLTSRSSDEPARTDRTRPSSLRGLRATDPVILPVA